MRTLIAATALAAFLLAPAYAQQPGQKQQTTSAQHDLATSVKAKHHQTAKRRNIIRSETGTTGSGHFMHY